MNITATRPSVTDMSRAFTLVASEVARTDIPVSAIDAKSYSVYGPRGMVHASVYVTGLTAGGLGEAGAAQVASLFNLPKIDPTDYGNVVWRGEWNLMGIFVEVYTSKDAEGLPGDCEAVE